MACDGDYPAPGGGLSTRRATKSVDRFVSLPRPTPPCYNSCFMNRDKGREILKIEAAAVVSLAERLGKEFDAAIDAIVGCKGHLVVTGMGKAGLVGQKISATFASTG